MKRTHWHVVACAVLVSAISATASNVQEIVDNNDTTAQIGDVPVSSYEGGCHSPVSVEQTENSYDWLRFTEVSVEIDKDGEMQVEGVTLNILGTQLMIRM